MALFAGFSTAALAGSDAGADETANALAAAAELQKKMGEIDEQYRQLMEKVSAIESERRELERLLAQARDLDSMRGGADTSGVPPQVGEEQKAEKEAAESQRPDLPRISPDVGGVLTPRGRLVLEPSLQYIYSSSNRLAVEGYTIPGIHIGTLDILEADRDTFVGNITMRYGLTNRLEFELRVPWVVRDDTQRTRQFLDGDNQDDLYEQNASDLGDIEFGIRYQLPRKSLHWPFLTANLRVKTDSGTDAFELASEANVNGTPVAQVDLPTGSGFWSISPSITFLFPSDPVVFFGNFGYLYTLDDDKGGIDSSGLPGTPKVYGKVDPGDAWRFNFGMGFSLNERSSFSLSYSLDIFDKTSIQGDPNGEILGSDFTVARFLMGYSFMIGKDQPFNLAIGIGATDDAPDTDITFRLPFNFLR